MYKIGVFPMKALPFHRGHMAAIMRAATMCKTLYVIVSDNRHVTKKLCEGFDPISLETRVSWVSEEFVHLDYIKVLGLDESDIPEFPLGWSEWAKMVQALVPEKIDVIFGNEESYREGHTKNFPEIEYVTFDVNRAEFAISGTEIRENPIRYWKYLPGSVRPYFCKKILIAGSESAGKTSLTKMLAKYFYTSWSEEVGRFYSERYLGGNENNLKQEDFERICWLQFEQDREAQRTANKVVFHDTDALITQFYLEKYTGKTSEFITEFAKRQHYDLIILMKPDIPWVADGLRWMADQKIRENNHEQIKAMYGMHKSDNTTIIEIGGNYEERYLAAITAVNNLLLY